MESGLWRTQRGGCCQVCCVQVRGDGGLGGVTAGAMGEGTLGMDFRPPGSGPAGLSTAPWGQGACLPPTSPPHPTPRVTEGTSEKSRPLHIMASFPTGQWTPGYKPNPEIYVQLIQECKSRGKEGEFSTCFTELQRDFLRNRPTKLKSLIRLVKHWYQTVWWVPSRQRAEEEEGEEEGEKEESEDPGWGQGGGRDVGRKQG